MKMDQKVVPLRVTVPCLGASSCSSAASREDLPQPTSPTSMTSAPGLQAQAVDMQMEDMQPTYKIVKTQNHEMIAAYPSTSSPPGLRPASCPGVLHWPHMTKAKEMATKLENLQVWHLPQAALPAPQACAEAYAPMLATRYPDVQQQAQRSYSTQ